MYRYIPVVLLLVVIGASIWSYALPVGSLSAVAETQVAAGKTITLAWPTYGQAAIGADGYGVLAENGDHKPVPIASIAKVMTALAVLQKSPLRAGQQGPMITVTRQDETIYDSYVAKNGSVVEVAAGEKISEYQALEAMLLPSANNIADLLANWSFGSINSYTDYANTLAKQLGMTSTHVADASGFSSDTTSTAHDLILLGQAALKNPVFAQIVGQKSAIIDIVGEVNNKNELLGQHGITGVKTGNTDQAGGCYLFAADSLVDGHKIKIIGAVLGAKTVAQAMKDAIALLESAKQNFGQTTLAKAGQQVGYYGLPWGGRLSVLATDDVTGFGWLGTAQTARAHLDSLTLPVTKGQRVGSIDAANGATTAVTAAAVGKPPLHWRLFRWL